MKRKQSPAERRFYAALGVRVKAERQRRKLTQERLARTVGVSRPSIANLERGAAGGVGVVRLLALARALVTDPVSLIPWSMLPTHRNGRGR